MSIVADTGIRRHRINVDEYYRMAEVGLLAPDARVELIEGEIIDMAPIGTKHAYVVDLLNRILSQAVEDRAAVGIQRPIRLNALSEPQPDVTLLKPKGKAYLNAHPNASDVLLVIEVSDTTLRYDLNVKASLYARHHIPEVWVVDVGSRRLHCLREPSGENYAATKIIQNGSLEIAALPDVVIDIASILTSLD